MMYITFFLTVAAFAGAFSTIVKLISDLMDVVLKWNEIKELSKQDRRPENGYFILPGVPRFRSAAGQPHSGYQSVFVSRNREYILQFYPVS